MRTKEEVKKIAESNGWKINDNDKVIMGNLRVQNRNYEKHGAYYCPCKPDKIKKNICGVENGCVDCTSEIKEMGHCTCNLYFDPNWKKE